MTAALETIHRHGVAANRLRLERMAHGRAFVDDLDVVLFQQGQPLGRVVPSSLDDLHATVDDGLHVPGVVGRVDDGQKGQIDAERLVGHVATTRDLIGEIGRRPLRQPGDDSQPAGVGHRGGQLGKADEVHATLNNWVPDSAHFGNSCFHLAPDGSQQMESGR